MSVFNRIKNSSHRKVQNNFPPDTLVADKAVSSNKNIFPVEFFFYFSMFPNVLGKQLFFLSLLTYRQSLKKMFSKCVCTHVSNTQKIVLHRWWENKILVKNKKSNLF